MKISQMVIILMLVFHFIADQFFQHYLEQKLIGKLWKIQENTNSIMFCK